MAGQESSKVNSATPPFSGYVLHVVEAGVVARWAPMLRQTLWALRESGLRTALLTDDAGLIQQLSETDVECHLVEQLTGWRAWRLARLLPERFLPPPAIVHIWGTAGLGWVQRWTTLAGIPLLVHAFGEQDVEHLTRRGLRPNQRIALASKQLAARLSQRFGAEAARWQTIVPAVALPVRHTTQHEGPRTLSVLCASHFDETAGLQVLIDALAQLRRDRCDVQVAIVGDGPHASAVWRAARERGVNTCCVLIDEPALWEKGLLGADVCVVPACQRDLWLAPLLAMGLGKLVIAARDQTAEWFIEGRTAWQFTPGSAVELGYLLARAAEQPKHVRDTCALAADYFYTHHSIGNMIERLVGLYRSAVIGDEGDQRGDREKGSGHDGA